MKYASNGDVFALGTGSSSAVIQRLSSTGIILWTRTLSAPTLYAIDTDVDGSDNVFIYVGLTTGQGSGGDGGVVDGVGDQPHVGLFARGGVVAGS